MRVKVKRLIPKTVFKAVLMAVAIPFMIFFAFMLLLAALGASVNGSQVIAITLFYLLLAPVVYGLVFMLLAASYNWLAPKFGGLEIEIDDSESKESQTLKTE